MVLKQSADISRYWPSCPHRSCSKYQHHPTEPRTTKCEYYFRGLIRRNECNSLAYSHIDGIFIQHVLICFVEITKEKMGVLA
jgi:hypothetical protein